MCFHDDVLDSELTSQRPGLGGVVGGLAGGMIAGAIIANQQPRYVYVPVRQHYYTPRHRAVYAAAPRRQYTHTVTTVAQPSGPSGDDLRGILGSH